MPRRSSGGGARRPSPPPQRAPVPAARPPPAAPPAAAPSAGPGLFGQMAATAGGVAIGSAVGHTVGHMMTGGGGSDQPAPAQQEMAPAQQGAYQQPQPCEFELRAFLDCSQRGSDLSACDAFNQQLKDCRARYGL